MSSQVPFNNALLTEIYPANLQLLVGDACHLTAAYKATKTASAGAYAGAVGIVVGGARTFGYIVQNDTDIGEIAAEANESVIIAWGGIVKCVSGGVIIAGRIMADNVGTPGRIIQAAALGFPLGKPLNDAGGAGVIVRVLLAISSSVF